MGQRVSQLSYQLPQLASRTARSSRLTAGSASIGGKVIDRMNSYRHGGRSRSRQRQDQARRQSTGRKQPVILVPRQLPRPQSELHRSDHHRRRHPEARRPRAASWESPTSPSWSRGANRYASTMSIDHFDHVRDLVGIEHVGVGSDAGIRERQTLGSPAIRAAGTARQSRPAAIASMDEHEVVRRARRVDQNRMYELTAAPDAARLHR